LDLKDIAERQMELVNPITPEKILQVGRLAGMAPGKQVIDFGSGYAEPLVLWAEAFDITGVGLELRHLACERARQKIVSRGMNARLEIVEGDAAQYRFELHSYDVAACVGASFIWNGYRPALKALKQAVRPQGRVIIGEPYWLTDHVPPELVIAQPELQPEFDLLRIANEEGYELVSLVRSSPDDWDTYEAGNWYGLVQWLEENPAHPERQDVLQHLHESQVEYFRYGRKYYGWALMVLRPEAF
jgi:SAM-dependent methyltransferase